MRAWGRSVTWWARTAQKSGSRLLPNAAVGVWLWKVFNPSTWLIHMVDAVHPMDYATLPWARTASPAFTAAWASVKGIKGKASGMRKR